MLNTTCACMLAPVVLRGTGQTRFQRSEESEISHGKCILFFCCEYPDTWGKFVILRLLFAYPAVDVMSGCYGCYS